MKNIKKLVLVGLLAVTAAEMTACTPGNNTMGATAAGAVAGGLLAHAAFGNSGVAGAIGGALVGGIVGNQIGNYMDRRDEENMQKAVATVPVGQQAQWTNNKGTEYTVRPVKNYRSASNQYCREYQTTVTVDGKSQKAYGKACRQPDGAWKLVS